MAAGNSGSPQTYVMGYTTAYDGGIGFNYDYMDKRSYATYSNYHAWNEDEDSSDED